MIYWRTFTKNINNSRKHHSLERVEFEFRNFIGAILDYPAVIEFFPEIVVKCELKPDEDIYKDIHIKSNCQDVYSSMPIFQSQGYFSTVLSVWNYSEEIITKHLKSGICWKVNGYYPAFSCFTGWSCPGIFFIQTHTHIDCLVAEFPVLEPLCSSSLYPINFKKACQH